MSRLRNLILITLASVGISAEAHGPYMNYAVDPGCCESPFVDCFGGSSGRCCESPFVNCLGNGGAIIEGTFIDWKATQEGLEYLKAIDYISTSQPFNLNLAERSYAPEFEWKPGFKVGLGYRSHKTGWYGLLRWTYFQETAKNSQCVDGPIQTVLPRSIAPILDNRFSILSSSADFSNAFVVQNFGANANWKLSYNVLDLEFGIPFLVNNSFLITPFASFRGVGINQKYKYNIAFAPLIGSANFLNAEAKSTFYAGGLRTGVDLLYGWSPNFGFYFQGSGSLVYGQFNVNEANTFGNVLVEVVGIPVPVGPVTLSGKSKIDRVRGNLEAAAGFQWAAEYCRGRWFTIRIGYEIVQWFEQNQFISSINQTPDRNSDLGIQGLTISARAEF